MIKDLTEIVKETTGKATELAAGSAKLASGIAVEVAESMAGTVSDSVTGTASAAGAVAGMATGAATDMVNQVSQLTKNQFDQQIDTVLDLMEAAARRTARRGKVIKDFTLSATLHLGVANVGLKVDFDPRILMDEELGRATLEMDSHVEADKTEEG